MISSSPGDLQPVFAGDAGECGPDLRRQVRQHLSVGRRAFHLLAARVHAHLPWSSSPLAISRPTQLHLRVAWWKRTARSRCRSCGRRGLHRTRSAASSRASNSAGVRTLLVVPMLKENELIGAFTVYRQEVRPFTDKQIELVAELRRTGRHRHREHAAAQRAARIAAAADRHRRRAESHQPLDVRLADGARHAGRISGAALRRRFCCHSSSARWRAIRYVASFGFPPEFDDFMREQPNRAGAWFGGWAGFARRRERSCSRRRGDPEYTLATRSRLGGYRTLLGVPLLREGMPIGVIMLGRKKCAHSPTSKSNLLRPSPTKRSSPSRTRGCSRRSSSARVSCRIAGAADGHVEGARGHQPIGVRSPGGVRSRRRKLGSAVRSRSGVSSSVSMASCCGWWRPLTLLQNSESG